MITIELQPGDTIELMTAEGHSMIVNYADIIQGAQIPDITPIDEAPKPKRKMPKTNIADFLNISSVPQPDIGLKVNPADIILTDRERALLAAKKDIAAIKEVRTRLGTDITTAKNAVDWHKATYGRPSPEDYPLEEDIDI